MPKYEIAIAVKNETDHTPGKFRKKEGDISSIKPYPRNCGRSIIDGSLIVIMECNVSDYPALKQRLRAPYWEDGLVEWVDWREFHTRTAGPLRPGEDDVDLLMHPQEEYVWDIQADMPMKRPKLLTKRRYKIPLNILGSIDMVKVKNKKYIYQPFKKASQLVKKFDGKKGRHKLKAKDVDCVTSGIGVEQEIVFQWSAVDNLVMDKHTNSYVEP